MNTFQIFFKDGSSQRVQFPFDWTMEDVLNQTGADEIMFVCVVEGGL